MGSIVERGESAGVESAAGELFRSTRETEAEAAPELTHPDPELGVIIVTGASSGTGQAFAEKALLAGYPVVFTWAHNAMRGQRRFNVVRKNVDKQKPGYGDRAVITQLDVTNAEQRIQTARAAVELAQSLDTTVQTLALIGAAGFGQSLEESLDINAVGQVRTARTIWEEVGETRDKLALTVFATSIQGHTAHYPNPEGRAGYPESYAVVAIGKSLGALSIYNFSREFNEQLQKEGSGGHILAFAVGDMLIDTAIVRKLREMAATEEGRAKLNKDDLKFLDREKELAEVGGDSQEHPYSAPTTDEYAEAILELVESRKGLEDGETLYVPELKYGDIVANGREYYIDGTIADWHSGRPGIY